MKLDTTRPERVRLLAHPIRRTGFLKSLLGFAVAAVVRPVPIPPRVTATVLEPMAEIGAGLPEGWPVARAIPFLTRIMPVEDFEAIYGPEMLAIARRAGLRQ